jgi:hypothetical protein
MSPLKEWLEIILRIIRANAHDREVYQKVQQRLFTFGIEIGQRRRLTDKERVLYENTRLTAKVLLTVAERSLFNADATFPMEHIMDACLEEWLGLEPKLRAALERMLGHDFTEVAQTTGMPPELRQLLSEQLKYLAVFCPDGLSEAEIESIIDRLEHPLDRA